MHPKAKQRLTILITATVGLLAVGGGAFAYRKMALRAEFADLRSAGLADAAAGRDEPALEKLKKYFTRFPDDADALSAFATSRLAVPSPGGRNYLDAAGALRRAINVEPSRVADRSRLADLLCDLGQYPDALDQAERVLLAQPTDAKSLHAKSISLFKVHRDKDAYAAAVAWAEGAPDDFRAGLMLLPQAKQTGMSPADLRKLATNLESRTTSDVGKAMLRATYAALMDDGKTTRNELLAAAALPMKSKDEVAAVASQMEAVGMAAEAAEYMSRAAEQKMLPGGRTIPARLLSQIDKYDVLLRLLTDIGPDSVSAQPELAALKAAGLFATGNKDASETLSKALHGGTSKATLAWSAALDNILGRSASAPEAVIKTVLAAMAEGENSPWMSLTLADAYARTNEIERALGIYDGLQSRTPAWATPLQRKARILASKGQLGPGMEAARAAVLRNNRDLASLVTLGEVWSLAIDAGIRDDKAQLDSFLKTITQVLPGDQTLVPQRIVMLARAGRTAEARGVIDNLVKQVQAKPSPLWVPVLQRVAGASAAAGLGGEEKLLDLAESFGGPTPETAMTRTLLQMSRGQPAEAVAAFKTLVDGKLAGPDARGWWLAKAHLLEIVGDPSVADVWIKAAETFPDDAAIQREAIASASVRSNFEFRARTIERLKAVGGENSSSWKLAQASLALDKRADSTELTHVSEMLTDLIRQSPGSVEARYRLALCLDRLGGTGAAIEQLREANKMAPESAPVSLLLSELLQRRGNFQDAGLILDRASGGRIVDDNQRRMTAALLAQQGEPEKAIDLMDRGSAAGAVSGGGADLLKARLYRQRNDLVKAEAEARAVVVSTPDVSSIRLLAEILRAQGKTQEATQTLAGLQSLKLDPGVLEMAMTEFYLSFMDLPSALKSANESVEKAPKNLQAWQAMLTVQAATGDTEGAIQTLEKAGKAIPDQPILASQLALVPAVRRAATDPVVRVAIPAVLQHPDDPALVDLIKTPTNGAMTDGGPAAALTRVRQLLEKYPLSQPVQMFGVRRFLQFGLVTEASAVAARATQSFPTAIEPAALATNAFATNGDWEQALSYSKVWRNRAASNPLPPDLAIADSLIKLGRHAEAIAVLQPYVGGFADDPQSRLPAIFHMAEAQSLQHSDEAAAATLAPALSGKPELWAVWLDYSLARLPAETTWAWLLRAEASPEARAPVLVWTIARDRATVLSTRNDPNAPAARATMIEAAGSDAAHMLDAAMVCERGNDTKMAATLYRKALISGGDVPATRNNLAMAIVREKGDLNEAVALTEAAIAKAPQVAAFHDTLASVRVARGELDQAQTSLKTAIDLDPAAVQWWIHLAEVQMKAGQTELARQTLMSAKSGLGTNASTTLRARMSTLEADLAKVPK